MVKKLPANTRGLAVIPGLGRSPGEGNGNPLQYSCLEGSMDRGDWWATVVGSPSNFHSLPDLLRYSCYIITFYIYYRMS